MGDKAVQPQVKGFDSYPVRLGDVMRGERATLGKSLLDVQRDLRIKAAYIAAIENCDPSAFQTPGFIAGFVRSYARYLSLDPDETFAQFCVESDFNGVHQTKARTKPKPSPVAPIRLPLATAGRAKDPLANARAPFAPAGAGIFDTISPSGLGSIGVLLVLILGLGYGAWAVLQDIQRVEFAPVNEPGTVLAANPDAPASAPQDRLAGTPTPLDDLYRPQELDVPVMVPRDGPIAALDPDRVGALVPGNGDHNASVTVENTSDNSPQVTEPSGLQLAVVASRPAWVRISLADGSVLFEKILNGGESFQLPENMSSTLLRAGNSGSVYLTLDGVPYGPVGQGGSVAKDVALNAVAIPDAYEQVQDVAALEALDSPRVITLNDVQAGQ